MTESLRRWPPLAAGLGLLVLYTIGAAHILGGLHSGWQLLLLLAQAAAFVLFGGLLWRQIAALRRAQESLLAANAELKVAQASLLTSNNARRATQGALRRSERRFRLVFDNMRNIIVCMGTRGGDAFGYDSGGVLLFGADVERIAGTRNPATGRAEIARWYDAIHPEDRPAYAEAEHRRKETGEPYRVTYRFTHPDSGEPKWAMETAWAATDPESGETFFDSYILDITEQKRLEQALRDSRTVLETVINSIPLTVSITDHARRIVLLNKAIEDLYGVRLTDVAGRAIDEFRPRRYRTDSAVADHRRVVETGEAIRGREDHYVGEQGEETWITNLVPIKDDQGDVKYVLRTTLEVPQLAKVNRDLADNRAILIEAEREARITSWHQPVGTDQDVVWSENAADVLGVPTERLASDADVLALVHPQDRERVARLFREVTERPAPYDIEYRIVRPDGTTAWVHGIARVQKDASGAHCRLIGTVQDVTERKRVEETLREQHALLLVAQRRARIGVWISGADSNTSSFDAGVMAEVLGVPATDVPRDDPAFLALVHAGDRGRVAAAYQSRIAGSAEYSIEYRIVPPDGVIRWMRELAEFQAASTDAPGRFIGTIQDVSEQKAAEAALRQSEARLRSFMDNAPVGMVVKDREGRVLAVNRLGAAFLGRQPEEVVGLRSGDFLSKGSEAIIAAHEQTVLSRGITIDRELNFPDRPGLEWTYEVKFPIRDAEGETTGLGAIVMNITERKRAELALRESEARMRAFMANVPMIMHVKDPQGRFDLVNREFERVEGLSADTVRGRTVFDVLPHEAADAITATDREVLVEGRIVRHEYSLPSRQSYRDRLTVKFPIRDSSGETIGIGAFTQDITERKQAEQALRTSEARLLDAQRRAKLAYWSWDAAAGWDSVWSGEAATLLGFPAGRVPADDEGYRELIHPDDRASTTAAYARLYSECRGYTMEYRVRRPDGSLIWIREIGDVTAAENGRPTQMLGTIQDVTAQKAIETALRESEARLRGFLDYAPFSMYLKDTQGRYLLVNREVERFQGMAAQEICGKTTDQIYPPALAERFQAEDRAVLERDMPISIEYHDPSLGSYRDSLTVRFPIHDGGGRIIALGGITQDITERNRAKMALQESEARFRSFMDHAPFDMIVKDLEGKYLMVNRGVEGSWGRKTADIVGRRIRDLARSRGVQEIEAIDREVIDTGQVVAREVHFTDLGEEWTHEVKFPIKNADGEMIAIGGVAVDISDRKRAEMALAQSEARLRGFMDNTPIEMMVKDLDGCYLMVNRHAENMWGMASAEILGRRISDIPGVKGADMAEALDREVIATGNALSREIDYSGEGTEWRLDVKFPIRDSDRKIVALGVVGFDITDRKRGELALKASEARLLRAQQQARLGYWRWHLASDKSTERFTWSPGSGLILGLTDEQMPKTLGQAAAVTHPDDARRMSQVYDEVRERLDRYVAEYRVRKADDAVVWVREIGEVVRGVDGSRIAVEGTMQDITEQRTLQEQLQQAQKIEALGQLTGGIAHDFNNLLAIVLGNLELLQESGGLSEPSAQKVHTAMRATLRGADLTQRLLAFARRQPLAPKLTLVNDLIRGMKDFLSRPLGPTIEIQYALAADLGLTEIDPAQLETSLLNLTVNARDAMPEGGKLTIATANVFLDPDHADAGKDAAAGDYVEISVGDSGRGMSAEVRARAFDPFFTTKAVGRGTGLGLSMVYGFVKQSGGHIKLDSEPGRGTTVRLYLPRSTRKLP